MAENATSEGVTQQTTSGGATSSGTPTAGTAEHPYPIFNDSDSLVLTVVLEFGAPDAFGQIMPVRGVGGGMVLGVEWQGIVDNLQFTIENWEWRMRVM